MSACAMGSRVERHFAGTISPPDERAMREHLPACVSCRDLYRRYLLLSRLDPAAPTPEERIARGLGFRRRRSPAVAGVLGFAGIAAAAAMLLVLRAAPRDDGFAARGGIAAPMDRPSRVFVYEVVPDGGAALAGDSLKSGDELAFGYENGAGKRRLAIFALDEQDRVYWFFPAWTSESTDPVAVPIETDAARHELPEAIRHRFEGTHLQIRSVFLDEPVSVRQIEALLRIDRDRPLPIPGAIERSFSLTVTP